MSGETRYAYTHAIASRATDVVPVSENDNASALTLVKRGVRTSLTFRKRLDKPCTCSFPSFCDSQKDKTINLDDKLAEDLEKTHVHSVYEKIAGHFSETRHKPWPKVMAFLDSLPEDSTLIDVGCGNGKYLGHHKKHLQVRKCAHFFLLRKCDLTENNILFQFGCDYSEGLAKICRERGFESLRTDCMYLPFKSGITDGVISIAVIHHLSTEVSYTLFSHYFFLFMLSFRREDSVP